MTRYHESGIPLPRPCSAIHIFSQNMRLGGVVKRWLFVLVSVGLWGSSSLAEKIEMTASNGGWMSGSQTLLCGKIDQAKKWPALVRIVLNEGEKDELNYTAYAWNNKTFCSLVFFPGEQGFKYAAYLEES